MLKIRPEIVEKIRKANTPADLYPFLQNAVELEHATIPAYLTAIYSIKPGFNKAAGKIIGSIVGEEMLHMTIAANVLIALGGNPVINKPGFIPQYPGPLPMGVHEGLVISLEKLTRGYVYNALMTIEEPETPISYPVKPGSRLLAAAPTPDAEPGFATIGDFYEAIIAKIEQLPPGAFAHPRLDHQVVDNEWYPADELFYIDSKATAVQALKVIIRQGEGTSASPLEDTGGAPAHYYRLAEIAYGRMLVADPTEPAGYSYSGAPVPLDPAGIYNLYANAKVVDYPEGTRVRYLAEQFNTIYTNLLNSLHEAFNGNPKLGLKAALGVMFELKLKAGELVSTPLPGTDLYAAPTFEYAPVSV